MKYIKIAALLIAAIALFGGAIALKEWVAQYVAISMLTVAPKSTAQIVIRAQRKAIAPKTITLAVKESRPDYAEMTLRQLKAVARGTGIKNWSRLTKPVLIATLNAQN
jgi:hypothetical protein